MKELFEKLWNMPASEFINGIFYVFTIWFVCFIIITFILFLICRKINK